MTLDVAKFMRPGACGSPSWQRLRRYAVYVDADRSVANQINTLADGAGHTFLAEHVRHLAFVVAHLDARLAVVAYAHRQSDPTLRVA
jgi:hypothetical protein